MSQYAYLFEARSIQPFLFASGKLADMVAGSEMIDFLCDQPLDAVLRACGVAPAEVRAARRAGGALYLIFDDEATATRVQALWRMLVAQFLPGIEQVDCIGQGGSDKEAVDAGLDKLRGMRNLRTAALPNPAPIAERSPRTGEVAVGHDGARGNESIDAATWVKRRFSRPGRTHGVSSGGLTAKFAEPHEGYWPNNFEDDAYWQQRFPLNPDRMVGLVHADGNGLGEILRVLSDAAETVPTHYVTLYQTFSAGLDEATQQASREATAEVLAPHKIKDVFPARPLVLGGDDLTILVRADLALAFTERFIQAFEQATRTMLGTLREAMKAAGASDEIINKLPEHLTACAGICFLKANQPFARGYQLAESLCERAKTASRKAAPDAALIPSSVAFYRVQASLFDDAGELFQREMEAHHQGTIYQLGLTAYRIGGVEAPLPPLATLRDLATTMSASLLNHKRLRALATTLFTDIDLATKDYARWRALAEKSGHHADDRARGPARALRDFDRALEALVGPSDRQDLPFGPNDGERRQSPLADLLALMTLASHAPIEETVQ